MGTVPFSGPLTGAGQVIGTPQYMAPEQIEHPLQVDHRADIYSLGVVFYQMLTGELPIGRFAPPSKKVQIDVRLDEVVLRALEKEPERRYQQASQLKSHVETIATSPPPCATGSASVSPPDDGQRPQTPRSSTDGAGGAVQDAANEEARRQVQGPAVGLLVAGILNLFSVPLVALGAIAAFGAIAGFTRSPSAEIHVHQGISGEAPSWSGFGVLPAILMLLAIFLIPMFLSGLMIFASLKMKRLRAYGLAVTASILAIVSPACLIGLPIGIWALVVLSQGEVRAAFGRRRVETIMARPTTSGSGATRDEEKRDAEDRPLFGIPLLERRNGIPQISWPGVQKAWAISVVCGAAGSLLISFASRGSVSVIEAIVVAVLLATVIVTGRAWVGLKRLRDAADRQRATGSASVSPTDDVAQPDTSPPSTGGASGTPASPRMADFVAALLGGPFTSPLARLLANASALGFLGFLASLAFVPLPGMHWCLGFSGFFGFFGLIGVAAMTELAAQRKAKMRQRATGSAGASPPDDVPQPDTSPPSTGGASGTPVAGGRGGFKAPSSNPDWLLWSPFQSPKVREISAHMTEAEKTGAALRGLVWPVGFPDVCRADRRRCLSQLLLSSSRQRRSSVRRAPGAAPRGLHPDLAEETAEIPLLHGLGQTARH